jgi:diadenosine tetraphosphate (Ap4A) HIT family hydrolase
MTPQATATMEKFGHPETGVAEFVWWSALFRRRQPTLGSLVLAAKADVRSFAELPKHAYCELADAVRAIEGALAAFVRFEKINYLMLMMVDPHPHFHVIPRYSGSREFKGATIGDSGWPGPPALDQASMLSPEAERTAIAELRGLFAVHMRR